MKIVIACDSFKESLSSLDVASAIQEGFSKVFPEAQYEKIALADGGEGTMQAIAQSKKSELIEVDVFDPLKRNIKASYALINDRKTAVIDMASASGLDLVEIEKRNPLNTSSYGFGQLIDDALKRGVKHIILGIGGSATNDGGIGMLQALGVEFFNDKKELLSWGAKHLDSLSSFKMDGLKARLADVLIEVACDVKNPLCGPSGASYVFGAQKGANLQMIEQLDKSLEHFANVCLNYNIDARNYEGAGAAGGVGFALVGVCQAQLKSGIELVLDTVNFNEYLKGASLVITGEGRMDAQTIYGKTPVGVAKYAKAKNLPVIAIVGAKQKGFEAVFEHGIDMVFDCTPCLSSWEELKQNAFENVFLSAQEVAKALKFSLTNK